MREITIICNTSTGQKVLGPKIVFVGATLSVGFEIEKKSI